MIITGRDSDGVKHDEECEYASEACGCESRAILRSQLAEAESENQCDACGGSGTPVSGPPCMCGGTGKMSEAARNLRQELVNLRTQLAAAEAGRPDDLRATGWAVAVHNDYRQNGVMHTFWLFTRDGVAIRGEGCSDAEALDRVRAAIREHDLAAEREKTEAGHA